MLLNYLPGSIAIFGIGLRSFTASSMLILRCAANQVDGEGLVHLKLFKTEFSSLVDSPPTGVATLTPVNISLQIRKFIDLVSNARSLFCTSS